MSGSSYCGNCLAGEYLSVVYMGCLCQEQQQVLEVSSYLLKVDHLGKIKLGKRKDRKKAEKLPRAKWRDSGSGWEQGVGSRKSGWEAVAQKTESREGKSQSACVPTQRQRDFQGKGKLYLQDTVLGRVSCPGAQPALSPQKSNLQRFRSSAQSCFICSQITVWLQNLFEWGFVFLCLSFISFTTELPEREGIRPTIKGC